MLRVVHSLRSPVCAEWTVPTGIDLPYCPSNHTLTRGCWASYCRYMKQTLTTKSINALKPAAVKRYDVRDAKVQGLHIRVSTAGSKIFYVFVRDKSRRRRLKIAPYPLISLAEARRKAMEIPPANLRRWSSSRIRRHLPCSKSSQYRRARSSFIAAISSARFPCRSIN